MKGFRGGRQRHIGWVLLAMVACDEPTMPLDAELLGCAEVWVADGARTCVRAADAPLSLIGDLAAPTSDAELQSVDAGSWTVVAADGALVVRDGHATGRWQLETAPDDPTVAAASAHRRAGEHEAAASLLRAAIDGDTRTAARRRAALARVVLASGDIEGALTELGDSARAAASMGFVSQALRDRLAAADTLRRAGRVDDASAILEELSADAADPEGAAHLGYQRVLAARDAGDLRGALRLLDEADATVARLSAHPTMRLVALDLGMVRGRLLEGLGRSDEAAESLAAVAELADAPCDRAAWLTNRGWVALLAMERGEATEAPEAEGRLELAVAAFQEAATLHADDGGCPDRARARNAAVNLALSALAGGDPDEADGQLARAQAIDAPPDARVDAWAALAEARQAAAAGEPTGPALYRAVATTAEARTLDSVAWQAWLGLGRLERARGRLSPAVDAFERAEALLEREVDVVPLGEGRGPLAERRAASAQALVDALLDRGDAAAALHALRRARSRPLRTLRSRARWLQVAPRSGDRWAALRRAREADLAHRRSAWAVLDDERTAFDTRAAELATLAQRALDELLAVAPDVSTEPTRLAPGELLLAWGRSGHGWRVFAGTPTAVIAAELTEAPARGDETSPMFAPVAHAIRAAIARGDTLRLVLPDAIAALPVQAFPFDGEPLLGLAPVVVAVDAGGTARSLHQPARASTLVVADPRGDLPAARTEGRDATDGDACLLVGDGATCDAVLEHLARARHFHYAGHASSEGSLLLAGTDELGVLDVLTLSAPPSAALLGCGTAAPTGDRTLQTVGTLGLAQAFVVAGSESVVATLRDVPDDATADFARALGPGPVTPDHFRRAALALRSDHPTAWDAFRLLVP